MHPSPYPTHPQAVSAWRRLERALVRLDPSRLRHRRLRRPQRRPRPRRHGPQLFAALPPVALLGRWSC
jgi:ferric-dicitrate binding protein FerR (iron transport regulator)